MKNDTSTPSDDLFPELSAKDKDLALKAWFCRTDDSKIDVGLLQELCGFKNKNSMGASWYPAKKRLDAVRDRLFAEKGIALSAGSDTQRNKVSSEANSPTGRKRKSNDDVDGTKKPSNKCSKKVIKKEDSPAVSHDESSNVKDEDVEEEDD